MTESGFIEIFVNNDAQTPVYYDNLMVTMSTGYVMEINAYYPSGKILSNFSTNNWLYAPQYNHYKYTAKERQTELGLDWLDYGARMYDPVVGRWWMPDPLAEMRYSLSPYSYCSNNPINRIDPTGMLDDGFTVDSLGHFTRVNNEGGDKYDVIYREDKYSPENAKNYDETGKKDGIKVSKKFLKSETTIKHPEVDSEAKPTGVVKYSHRYEVESDKEASAILEFMGKNTKVEWGNNYLENANGGSLNFLITSHEPGRIIANYDSQRRYVRQGYQVMRYDHTHPSYSSPTPSYADKQSGKATLEHSPNAIFRVLYKSKYYPFVPAK